MWSWEFMWGLSASVINTNKVSHTLQPLIGCNAWLYFTVGQTVDRSDPLDQRESHWYRTFVGILRLLRPSKGIEVVSGHHFPLIKQTLTTQLTLCTSYGFNGATMGLPQSQFSSYLIKSTNGQGMLSA